ncbi:MAG: helix-turn-helix transcriptional regulator [Ruminococcaceae bacterium]|nr:helix-turn-helix transcriptional regulator [Oscillospiraceae bacterium]
MKFENLRIDKIRTVVRYKPDIVSWRAANRKDHIIGINISGIADHDLGYKHIDLKPDYIYFFNQRDDFSALTKEAGYCYSVHFTTTEPIETDSFCKKVNNTEEIVKMIEKLERSFFRKDNNELSMLSEFYSLCDLLNKLNNTPYTKKDNRLLKAKEYLDVNFKEKSCLDGAADICQISRRRFNDVFRVYIGVTPNQYVTSKKIEHAKELLALGYLTVSDISELSGFSDIYYFSKIFKQQTGITPSQYRKEIGKND